jgi:hypothetical protein
VEGINPQKGILPNPIHLNSIPQETISISETEPSVEPQPYPKPSSPASIDFEEDLEEFITTWGRSATPLDIDEARTRDTLKGADFWQDFAEERNWD